MAPKALSWLRRRFIAGFFVTVPLIISVAALVWIFQLIDDLSGPVYDQWLGVHVPGLGLVTTAVFVLMVGVVASNVFGKRVVGQAERILVRIPVFRTIYSPVRQLLTAFSPDNESGLKRVALARDATGGMRLGFVTKEFEIVVDGSRRAFAALYVPTNNLYLGDVFVYPMEDLIFPEIPVEEGVRVFLTGGMALADRVSVRTPKGVAAASSPDPAASPSEAI
jgi:uncharacterized membrane protein